MGKISKAYICLNGHDLCYEEGIESDIYCQQCGKEVITRCPNCKTNIKGPYIPDVNDEYYFFQYSIPRYCPSCGSPYPWTAAAIESMTKLLKDEEDLSESVREGLIESLGDITVDGPNNNLAVARFQRAVKSVGKFTAEALRQFVIDFGSEFARKSLGF